MFRWWQRPRPDRAADLVGRWKLVRVDGDFDVGDGITMVVAADGTLTTILHDGATDHVSELVYHVAGSSLVTQQPSQPAKERTRFRIEDSGHLVLTYGHSQLWFIRVSDTPH